MSDALVEVPAGDTNDDQPENSDSDTLNVETQPSLLKKGGLFGKSVAMSPKVGDGTPSPAEKASANGNEVTTSSKNGNGDANANGDHKDEGENDDEVMVLDDAEEEPAEEEEEEDEEEEPAAAEEPEPTEDPAEAIEEPAEPAEAAEVPAEVAAVEEPVVENAAAEVMDDIEMEDEAEEEDEESDDEVDNDVSINVVANDSIVVADDAEAEAAAAVDDEEMEEEEADETKEESKEEEEEEKEESKDEEEEEEPKEAEAAAAEETEEAEEEEEEVCVKKVVSMDTDETAEEPAEAKEEEEEAKTDASADVTLEEKHEDEEEKAAVATPKRGRGRPPKSASGTPASIKKTPAPRKAVSAAAAVVAAVEEEEADAETTEPESSSSSPSKRTPRGAAKKAAEAIASPPPSAAKGRGRRSIKSDTSSQVDTEEKEEVEEEAKEEAEETAEEQEPKTPAAGRGRRSVKSTPATATRVSSRGKKVVEEKEDEEEQVEEKEAVKEEEEEEKEEAAAVVEKTPRGRGRRSAATAATTTTTPATAKSAKSVKKETDDDDEKEVKEEAEEASVVSSSRRSTRGSPTKTPTAPTQATPKGRGRKSSMKSEDTMEEEEEEEKQEEVVEKKGRGRGRKSAAKTPTTASAKKGKKAAAESDEAEDPFDLDTELDKHPEPLRNITVEKGSFGAVQYSRSPAASKSKYAATERAASDKVANLPNTPAATGTPKTIASVQSTRKSLGGSPVKRTPAASSSSTRKSKRGGGAGGDSEGEEGGEEEEDMDMDEEGGDAAMVTPAEKKGRGRPAGSGTGSTGRKRKAEETPAAPSSVKRQAVSVTIPVLDEEKQWAADHPEDDSAPFIPGARVFAVFQKVFYPALVGERDGLGRYLVEFVEDGIVRPVPPAGVVPLSAVTIDKECLYAASPDADPIYCRVLKSANAANAKEWQQGMFKLMQMDNEEIEHEANWTTLQLDVATAEWKKYVNAKSKMVTKINTDNITSLEDRRERRSRVHNDTAVALATFQGTPEPTSRRSITKKTPATAKATPKTPASATTSSGARRGRKPKAAAAAAEEEKEAENEQAEDEKMETGEPAKKPEINPRIFLNKTFILTSANRTTTDVVFKKNEMKKQILERGGIVLEDINQVPLDAEAYLISDTHYRTHKYLAAMSRGMPCLSHMWLIACVGKEEFLSFDEYKLAGGQGLLNGELYPLPDVRGKLLVGRSIMVHSKTDSSMKRGTMGFKQIWSPIVELLGAEVEPDTCLTECAAAGGDTSKLVVPGGFEILLTDSSCPTDVVKKLEAAGKAVVSSEWLIQSIIMGACPDFNAHPRFRYDSGNEPAAGTTSKKEGSQEQTTSQS